MLFAAVPGACSAADANGPGAIGAGGTGADTTGALAPPPLRVANRDFDVIAVDGGRLPLTTTVIGRGSCVTVTLGRITLTFTDQQVMMRFWTPGDTGQGALYVTGFVQAADGSLSLSGGSSLETGNVRGDTLTLGVAAGYLCGRHSLTALVHAAP
jgi:hypothetical protein